MIYKIISLCVLPMALILTAGCASTSDPVIIKVPVPVHADPLPIPDVPVWQTPTADPADVTGYIRALAHDLISAWSWGTELQHVIKSHNKVISNEPQ